MPGPNSSRQPCKEGLDELLARAHGGLILFNYEGSEIPCILADPARYARMASPSAGSFPGVGASLDIMDNGAGDVFVDVLLSSPDGRLCEKFLVDARKSPWFFNRLAETGLLAVAPEGGSQSVFLVQLPRIEPAQSAYRQIIDALAKRA